VAGEHVAGADVHGGNAELPPHEAQVGAAEKRLDLGLSPERPPAGSESSLDERVIDCGLGAVELHQPRELRRMLAQPGIAGSHGVDRCLDPRAQVAGRLSGNAACDYFDHAALGDDAGELAAVDRRDVEGVRYREALVQRMRPRAVELRLELDDRVDVPRRVQDRVDAFERRSRVRLDAVHFETEHRRYSRRRADGKRRGLTHDRSVGRPAGIQRRERAGAADLLVADRDEADVTGEPA